MHNFFRKLFCCTSVRATSPIASERTHPNRQRQSTSRSTGASRPTEPSYERRRSHQHQAKPVKKFLNMKTAYTTQDIRVTETRDEDTKDLKFNCPICFRYFDKIMVSSCCKNYLCHFCAEDLNEKIKKDEKLHTAKCFFCDIEDFQLTDVDPNERPKKYTDSFYSSFKSNTKGAFFTTNRKVFQTTNQANHFDTDSVQENNNYSPPSLKDPRSASDGLMYMKKEMQQNQAMTRTFQGRPNDADQDDYSNPQDLANVIQPTRIEYTTMEFRKSQVSEGGAMGFDDSLNEREPIEVIKEDEFESSVMPESVRHLENPNPNLF